MAEGLDKINVNTLTIKDNLSLPGKRLKEGLVNPTKLLAEAYEKENGYKIAI